MRALVVVVMQPVTQIGLQRVDAVIELAQQIEDDLPPGTGVRPFGWTGQSVSFDPS